MNLNTELINRTEVLMPPTVKEQTAIAEITYCAGSETVQSPSDQSGHDARVVDGEGEVSVRKHHEAV